MEVTGITHVLLDIEGTIVPITFVKDVLFPYARANLNVFLDANLDNDKVQQAIADVKAFSELNPESPKVDGSKETVVKNVLWQMDRDLKTAGLKALQGMVWLDGYKKELRAPMFDDVVPQLRKWHKQGLKLGIYSSGSVFAQRLLFENTKHGSLLSLIDSYHDLTTAGSKIEPSSYASIAKTLQVAPEKIIFLTDVFGEYRAAGEAGLKSAIVIREGNQALTKDEKSGTPMVTSLSEISLK